MSEKITCPRRIENGMDVKSALRGSGPNLDGYANGHGIVGQGRGCTYCGSMNPDDFMEAVKEGAELGPSDKNYKVYVHGYKNDGPNGGKFYFQHLSVEQRHEFVQLLNDKKVAFEYPGRFYVLPYFIQQGA